MLRYFIILFLMLPFIDFYLLIKAAEIVGFLETIVFSIATGLIGATLVKKEGKYVMKKLQRSVTGQEATRNFAEGFILVLSGLMLLSPGFLTDIIGALISFRPIRERLVARIADKYTSDLKIEFETF
jgi:UPF0716 protein FxsA